jgi:protein-disulfide isomerase
MTSLLRLFAATTAVLLAVLLLPAAAQSISPAQRKEIEAIIKDYLVKNPEVLQEAYMELEKRQAVAEAAKHQSAVKDHAEALFNSKRQVVLGNPKGDVTMVEFFDYNCGYCKRALSDMLELMKGDPKLRVVLKEFPVLGEASLEAARVSVAARMQDATGKKFLDFHQKLLGNRGSISRAQALSAAKDAGFDMSRLERDAASDEPKATVEESFKLADALGLSGTPSYVIGSEVVVGAVGLVNLQQKVNAARCGKASC